MVLQLAVSIIYELVRQSWLVSTVLMKYLLILHVAELAYRKKLDWESFGETVMKYSRPTLLGIVTLAAIVAITGVELQPRFKLVGELVALGYFGFLFWKF